MKLSENDKPADYPELRVEREKVRLLWDCGWWGGPMDGMAEFEGEPVWFSFAEESEEEPITGWHRKYWLVRLTSEQLRKEQNQHEDFRKYVGTHCDYDAEGNRPPESIHTKEMSAIFYEKYGEEARGSRDLSQNEVIGWFEW